MIDSAFTGRLGRDAELRHVKGGALAMLSFSAAVETRATAAAAGDAGEDETQWVRVVRFGPDAETLAPRLTKSARVYVEGRLKLDHWTDQDGAGRAGLNVVASLIQPLGQIGRRRPKKPRAAKAAPANDDAPTLAASADDGTPFNDDIPF